MITRYMNIQQRLNYYNCYVKHLIASWCEEFQCTHVHIRRISTALERLLNHENDIFYSFFNSEQTITKQLVQYLVQQGEILHIGDGEYILPPERVIQMPDDRYFGISMLTEKIDSTTGIAILVKKSQSIQLNYEEYIYRPSFEKLLDTYSKKLTNHHDVNPSELIYFKETGMYKTSKMRNLCENEYYILFYERLIGSRTKKEKYFAQWKNNEWYVAEIKKDYRRLTFALRNRKNEPLHYSVSSVAKKNSNYLELILPFSLPIEEQILLSLIATPFELKNNKKYLLTIDQIQNVQSILQLCGLQRKE